MNLDAYLGRIGYPGKPSTDLASLHQLQRLHVRAIPFENLGAFLGEPVKIDLASLEEKLVQRRRGGWCFEQNLLFAHALRAAGFELKTLAARVRWNVPEGVTTARSHMLMVVRIAGASYIADVGFGGLTLTSPLRLESYTEQHTPHEFHRLIPRGEGYALEAKVAGEWHVLYVFDLHEQLQADYEVSNWYLAHFPQSQFVTGILAARADDDVRYTLRNTRYQRHFADGRTERNHLASVADLKEVLAGPLQIPLPDVPHLDQRLQDVIDANPAP